MRKIDIKNTFKKDYRQVLKQGWNEIAIDEVIKQLANDDILNSHLKAHQLSGDYKGYMECHIFADLVIIYKRDTNILSLYRIGRHQDLFKKY
ncbi:type II toxin-antitoxin system YafQ family toxin [Campylobacter upsaliensis]|uniref:type II toxin-antitoxin system RelE/ParE family toxin n=1 Tax=Campylobacter upsaliensis TaxID=28080 RepID=UPI00214A8B01|nr:type II toxin-antitoxin system YafQ family toxin [Campylobacter upsaliensis]MCR2099447.1 type II toxin-antitoxin system YafQ family toxin [Campylobacter upsaliensis]